MDVQDGDGVVLKKKSNEKLTHSVRLLEVQLIDGVNAKIIVNVEPAVRRKNHANELQSLKEKNK